MADDRLGRLAGLAAPLCAVVLAAAVDGNPTAGGDTTVALDSREAFSQPLANLGAEHLRDFTFGRHLFRRAWVMAPASVASLDGLGPLFNRTSCSGCHVKDGRGRPPADPSQPMKSMLVRLSVAGAGDDGVRPHPIYGGQLQDRGILEVTKEGRAVITYQPVEGAFDDGEPFVLQRPVVSFEDLAYGPLGDDVLLSPRVAPAVFGLGLLEAVPDDALLALADGEDADGDGISGRVNMVWDETLKAPALGRFGWKANQPSLRQQVAGALLGDMGITTNLFPDQNCMPAQAACRDAVDGGRPEIDAERLDRLVLYTTALGVPARREVDDPDVARGEGLFRDAGCGACHVETMRTGDHPLLAELAGQTIHAYTDLLLHDMGDGLADGRPDFGADGNEWRTPPLWGIGLVERVNRHDRFLHDGRARGLMEAVLWHGGEAAAARDRVLAMPKADREALIRFLNAL